MNTYKQIMNAKGSAYYCNYCDEFHPENEMIFEYTIKTVGRPVEPLYPSPCDLDIICPDCESRYSESHSDIEDFDPMQWTHLKAFFEKNPLPVKIKFPIFGADKWEKPIGYCFAYTVDEMEKIADKENLCIEVVSIEYNEYEKATVVEVDLL